MRLLAILLLAATTTPAPTVESASLKILSPVPAADEVQDSRIVQAAKNAVAARTGHEAKVSIDRGTLKKSGPADSATGIASTDEAPKLSVDRNKPDPLAALNATLSRTSNVKRIKAPSEPETAPAQKQ
jgi:hypothetical protein